MPKHEIYMSRCLKLAQQAKTAGHTPVGSLIVQNGKIIAEAFEGEGDLPKVLAHAEMLAVLKAREKYGKELRDTTLYTTVEPCFMCSYLMRQSGISQVVYGITTPETGGHSSQFPFLNAEGIEKWKPAPKVIGGVMSAECEALFKR